MWFLVLGFPVGIVGGVLFPEENAGLSPFLLLVLACCGLGFARTKISGPAKRTLTVLLLFLTTGAGWQWGAISSLKLAPWALPPDAYFLTGEVVELPSDRFYSQRLKVRMECLGVKPDHCEGYRRPWLQALWGQSVYAHINLPRELDLVPGARVRFRVRFSNIETADNPAEFDVHRWLLSQHVVAQFVLISGSNPKILDQSWFSVDRFRLRVNRYLAQQQDSGPPAELSPYAVILALVTGDRSLMSDLHWDVFNRTGTSHLVAISGLHIGLVAAFIIGCTQPLLRRWHWFTDRYPASHGSIVIALAGALIYAAVAGFAFPVQRAVIMLTVFVALKLSGRIQQRWFALALAFCLVLTWDPVACVSLGFWLSFVAVYLIIWVVGGSAIIASPVRVWVRVQVGLLIGLAPILLWQVQATSLVSMLTNLIAVPVVGFLVVPFALLWVLLWGVFGASADVVLVVLSGLVKAIIALLEQAAAWEWSIWSVGASHWTDMVLAMAGVLWLCSAGVPGRLWGLILLAPIFLAHSQGYGLTVLQSKQLQMAIYLPDRVVFVSDSHWPQIVPDWHEKLLRYWGLQMPAALVPVEQGAELWRAEGLVATEYRLERNWLGQAVVEKVIYQDVCGSRHPLRYGVVTLSALVAKGNSRYCALQWNMAGQTGLFWPAAEQGIRGAMLSSTEPLPPSASLLVLEAGPRLRIEQFMKQVPASESQVVLLGDWDAEYENSDWLTEKLDRGLLHNLNQDGFFYIALKK
ncbi:ComEC family competence protein [Ketobacter sp. MCCC 1A13808]|uniref:ComEC/Rec2 family competence protein n=1 Tax=Ketobacter sp. MCCC 1A13808 TaxID=2602738 RepID=UPI0012EC38E0|nr:ComEC/Rec2 family competence protein [Ketobacter sp. MCCC 1A13808]MVF10703.1 ComEC family competence protein [Ketobacter sp. MCCC 1A13808]